MAKKEKKLHWYLSENYYYTSKRELDIEEMTHAHDDGNYYIDEYVGYMTETEFKERELKKWTESK